MPTEPNSPPAERSSKNLLPRPTAIVAGVLLVAGLALAFVLGQSNSGIGKNVPITSASGTASNTRQTMPAAVVMIGSAPATGSSEPVSFVPTSVSIHAGQTVEWIWDDGSVPQNVTFAAGFHSTTQTSGTYFHTFDTTGVFPYSSTVHFNVNGAVLVQ
ncbi:MAG: cupredoxin domain-containing protein [Acidimicrobiales bacterium]